MQNGVEGHSNPAAMRPSPEAVRERLHAVLNSEPFVSAARSRRFLTYITEETLAGRTDGIKESLIGLEVFDRPADFDPKVDTVVRVEAGKLRKRLDLYYEKEGAVDRVLIEVPKGGYVPVFSVRQAPAALAGTAPVSNRAKYAVAICALAIVVAFASWGVTRFRAPGASPVPTIVVLPFLNLSGQASDEYFSDGMTEELTDALCNAGGLRVVSRTSAFFFKGKQADVHEISSRLHVAFLVEGSVRRQGQRLKVTTQLIRAEDGYHLWSGSFEREMTDVFAVQQQIAESLVSVLQIKMASTQQDRVKRIYAVDRNAFDLYLQGKHVLNSRQGADLALAESLLLRSIAADPSYAPTYVALTQVYALTGIMSDRPASELFSKANVAIHKAIALDGDLAEAHAVLGTLSARHDHDLASAERHLRHALELNPSSSQAHYELAQNVLAPQERWPEALAENRLASELDPLSPLIAYSQPWLAVLRRDHDESVNGFRKLMAAAPGDRMVVGGLSAALMGKGDYEEAIRIMRAQQARAPTFSTLALIGHTEARRGNTLAARQILKELESASQRNKVPAICFALVNMGLGNPDESFRYLELARRQGDFSYLIFARVAHLYDLIRSDPQFPAFLRTLGLSDEQVQRNQQLNRDKYR